MKGKGCANCNKTGYRGRMGIYELMTMTAQVREMTFKGESTQNVRKMARKQGMHTLFEDGMIKALKGLTTLDEVLRITQTRDRRRPAGQEVSREPTAIRPAVRLPCAAPPRRSVTALAAGYRSDFDRRRRAVRPSSIPRCASRPSVNRRAVGASEKSASSLDPRAIHRNNAVAPGQRHLALTSRHTVTIRWTPGSIRKKSSPARGAVG